MSNYIKKTKEGSNFNIEVRAPIRRATATENYEDIVKSVPINTENKFKSSSILSKLDGKNRTFSNIEGVTVMMFCKIHDDVTQDEVTVRGEMGNFYIVQIDGVLYSINKSCAMFVKIED